MSPPETTFLDRRDAELRFKLDGLPAELRAWRERARADTCLMKNYSQIRRVTLRLEGLQDTLTKELKAVVELGELWLRAKRLEQKALALHTTWDIFRTKFALRQVAPFNGYLALADAFARECYLPAYKLLGNVPTEALCPAPLITFDNQVSPWARPRDPSVTPDGKEEQEAGDRVTPGGEEKEPRGAQAEGFLTDEVLGETLKRLPLTLLGVPWSYLAYLPHMALLAHEAGHALERDASLTPALASAISTAPFPVESHRAAWMAWQKEVFADVFGCWMGGPAFGWALADHLSDQPDRIASQARPYHNGDWTDYPTATLRVWLTCATLTASGFPQEASDLGTRWARAYPRYQLTEYRDDVAIVVDRLSAAARLPEVVAGAFRTAMMEASRRTVNRYRAGMELSRDDPQPARVYVTAARLLMDSPPARRTLKECWEALIEHHLETLPPKLAGPGADAPEIDEDEERRQGARLAEILFANPDAPGWLRAPLAV